MSLEDEALECPLGELEGKRKGRLTREKGGWQEGYWKSNLVRVF